MPPRTSKKNQHARNKRTNTRTSPSKSQQRGRSRTKGTAVLRPTTDAGSSSEADSQPDEPPDQDQDEGDPLEEDADELDAKLPPSLQHASLKSQVLDVVSRTDPALQLNTRLWACLHLLQHFQSTSASGSHSEDSHDELRRFLESFSSGPIASASTSSSQGRTTNPGWTLGEEVAAGLERRYEEQWQRSRDNSHPQQSTINKPVDDQRTDAWAAKLDSSADQVQEVARQVEGTFEEVVQHVNVAGSSSSKGKVGAEEVLGAAQESGVSQDVLQRCVLEFKWVGRELADEEFDLGRTRQRLEALLPRSAEAQRRERS